MQGPGLESARDRVLQFEREMSQNIDRATRIEKEIKSLAEMRQQYIDSMTSMGTNYDLTNDHVRVNRSEASIIALDMILAEYEIKEVRGNQELHLIELSTRPLATNETYELRNQRIGEAQLQNQELAAEVMVGVISNAFNAKARLKNILHESKNYESAVQTASDDRIKDVKARLEHFITSMQEYIAQSEVVKKKVTADYLVLRHNSRVAEKILCERRQAAVVAREEMQKNLNALLREASLRRSEVEESLKAEQSRLIQEARENVMNKENEVDELALQVKGNMRSLKNDRIRIKESIKNYEQMYKKLLKKREKEVKEISAELKKFRDMIAAVEMKLLNR